MKKTIFSTILIIGLFVVPLAHAQSGDDWADSQGEVLPALTDDAETPAETAEPKKEDESMGYVDFMRHELHRIGDMDLYGVTSQLPKGYLSVKYDLGTINAKNRYDNRRRLGPVMPPIEFSNNGQKELSIDMGLKGYGGGHTFQMSYGISNPLDWYIEIPFTYMNISFNPKVNPIDEEGNLVGKSAASLFRISDRKNYSVCQFMSKTLPMLGRPAPALKYNGEWLLGDINTGFSWNIYRSNRFSVALTPRVYLPTGYVPDPESNLLYGTGPAVETGIGGWAVSATQGYDLRLFSIPSIFMDVILSSEFTGTYAFQQSRKYPKNFVKPDAMAAMLDPISFPDLSGLSGEFKYTPGWSLGWNAQLNIQLAIFGFGIGYGVDYSQEPELVGDPAFLSMAKGLQLLGAQTTQAVQFAGSVSLLGLCEISPVCIPLDFSVQYTKVVDGYNALVFDNFWQFTFKGYIPINPSDEKEPASTGGI